MHSSTPLTQREEDAEASRVPGNSPSMRSLRKKRNLTPSTPQTAATELLTPLLDTPLKSPFGSVSSQPCTAPVTAPLPRNEVSDIALQDHEATPSSSARWDDDWNQRALFQEDDSSPRAINRKITGRSDSLPPPIPPREGLPFVRDISGSSSNGQSSRRTSRTTHRAKTLSIGDTYSSSSLGMSERRRSSSHSSRRSFSNFSMLWEGDNVKLENNLDTPLTASCSDTSPDSSPSPPRDVPKHRRRQSSPTPAEIELLPLRARLTYKLGRVRTNRLVLLLCVFGIVSLGFTILTNRSIAAFQDDGAMDAEQLERIISRYEQMHDVRIPRSTHSEGGLRGQLLLKHKGLGKKKISSLSTKTAEKGSSAAPKEKIVKKDKRPGEDKDKLATKDKQQKHHVKPQVKTTNVKTKAVSSRESTIESPALLLKESFFAAGSKRRVSQPSGSISSAKRSFEAVDESMFSPEGEKRSDSDSPRIFSLHDPITDKTLSRPRSISTYPADFTDNTQLYSILDSSDERLSRMEIRDPYSDEHCVPMQDWQTTYHPSCNGMHELALEHMGSDMENDFHLFGTKGYWRNAWRIDVLGSHHHVEDRETAVLKTLKFEHNFEDAHFEHDRIDAVAMERLTSSPHVINVFGFCGHSVITEYADGSRVGELADKSKKTPLTRLRIARDIANGLADVHGIDGDGNATFVHLDINPANVVSVGGTLKLNDFNIGIIRRWNTTSNTPCGFPAQYPNPQWRSPEEARNEQNLTEKVDIFSMGHIFFRLICGHEPWNKLEPGGKPTKEEINQKVQQGMLPFIPDDIMNTNDKEVSAIREAMIQCYEKDPSKRPSARKVSVMLENALNTLTGGSAAE